MDVGDLTYDPDNARLHPEENDAAIRESLSRYGQLKPLVVRREGMIVVAGNGTLQAARGLGWRELACNVVDMDRLEAIGYGLADNRTAELARWDDEVVARLAALMAESESVPVGWTEEQVAAIRASLPGNVLAPDQFPEVNEDVEVEHRCPRCGYAWSGGPVKAGVDADAGDDPVESDPVDEEES